MVGESKLATKQNQTPSKAYLRFEGVIKRSLNLLTIQSSVEKTLSQGGMSLDISDISRASVVLAVSAMDAYFTGIFAERLVPFVKKKSPSKGLIELLQQAGLNTRVSLELLTMDRPYRRVRKLIDSYLDQHTTQRIDSINKLFLAYGIKNFCQQVERKARRKTLLKSIRILVQRRHEISHKGDLNSHGGLKSINLDQIKTRVMDVVKFVSCADEILQRQLACR